MTTTSKRSVGMVSSVPMMSNASRPDESRAVGQGVGEHVAVLATDRDVGIADPDAGGVADRFHRGVGGSVGRARPHVGRNPEVVGDDPLVAVPVVGAEVLVDDLTNRDPVVAGRGDGDLLGFEALLRPALLADQPGKGEPAAPEHHHARRA